MVHFFRYSIDRITNRIKTQGMAMNTHRILIRKSTTLLLFVFLVSSLALAAEPDPVYTEPTTRMQFVYIPGGTFTMGDPTGIDPVASPAHEVTIDSFYIGKFEVTFVEYDLFARETGRALPDDKGWGRGLRPVIHVSWNDAEAFAKWLSEKTKKNFRLPAEAEWEYAARGGTTTFFYWGNDLGRDNANCRECDGLWGGKSTSAVGSFKSNPFGLFDMAGNVYEWLVDTEHRSYDKAPKDGSAWIDKSRSSWRMTRGGSWNTAFIDVMNHTRCWDKADIKSDNIGFRLVLEK